MKSFFEYARERQAILRRRTQGKPRPWTEDAILNTYRFCNVYREDDVTTKWFREHVREPMRSNQHVLLATVVFRWFNRIATGEAIFKQLGDWEAKGQARTAWSHLLLEGDTEPMRVVIRQFCGDGPYVTGAYIIKTPDGKKKLDGVLWCIEQFNTMSPIVSGPLACVPHNSNRYGWWQVADDMLTATKNNYHSTNRPTLQSTWEWLRKFPYLGDFMAYEIVTDLRHTDLLCQAPDIYTWANPGPGAMRGLNRLHGRELKKKQPKHTYVCEMRELLRMAEEEYSHIWPHRSDHQVEMRDIEHTLCEYDKYERVRLGEGRPRGVYR